MSRCFPFPPPGYEKKAGPDDENLLAKEKEKEKKHKKNKEKKEKKDREGRQNKDKEKNKDKHREKKDQNEKHKDKNNKHREKEKNRTSDEKYIAGPLRCTNGETPGSNCTQSEGTSEFKFLVELGKRIRNEDKATENPMVQKINVTGKRNADLPGEVLKGKRDDDRKVFGQSNKIDTSGNENGSVPNFIGGNERKVEGVAGLDKYVEKRMEQKENDKHKSSDSKGDTHKDRDRDKKSKSKDKRREKKAAKEEKAKEKAPINEQPNARENNMSSVCYSNNTLLKKNNENSHFVKRKELEMNGNLPHDDDIRPSKLQRPLPSSHEVVENGRKLETCMTSTHSYTTSTQSVSELVGTANNHKVINRTASSSRPVAENGPKLGATPAKIQFGEHGKVNNNVVSSRPVLENGRILDMCTAGTQFASSEWRGTSNDHKVDSMVSLFHPVLKNGKVEVYEAATSLATGVNVPIGNQTMNGKEIKINGLIDDKKPDICSTRPAVSPVKVGKSVGKSLKPPHPDSKYLSQILNIPSVEWSDLDDQEWLWGSYDFQTNKVRSSSSQVKETKQVWAEALQIESADIIALPYVIPY